MLVLFTDTDTDCTPKIAEEYGYKLISMPYSIDGKTVFPYVDFQDFDYKSFYDLLRSGVIPNTSAISAEVYRNYFEPFFQNGDDILYVHFSRAMSASFDAMDKTVEELLKKYPGRKFYEIDTKNISVGSFYIVRFVGEMYKAGFPVEEIVKKATEEIPHVAMYFFADDLKFFKHSGRVSGLTGTMGTLLGIRPIIYIGDDGKMVNIGKEKGRAKAIDRLVKTAEELGNDIQNHRVIVGHSDSEEIADELIEALKEKFGAELKVEKLVINPTIGSHCGPNSIGITFHAKHR